jgi:hypothetical protein
VKTIEDHGKTIAKLTAELNEQMEAYLGFCNYPLGHPLEKRKQLGILKAFVSAHLPVIQLEGAAGHRRWLAARPQSGLIIK